MGFSLLGGHLMFDTAITQSVNADRKVTPSASSGPLQVTDCVEFN